jgi:hypothetical protein
MKVKYLLGAILLCLFFPSNSMANALFQYGSHIIPLIDLPETNEYAITSPDGTEMYGDLGICLKQVEFMGIPLWNYGFERYCYYNDDSSKRSTTVSLLDREDVRKLQDKYYDLPSTPELPFWDSIGGKLLFLVIVFLVYYIFFFDKKRKRKLINNSQEKE